MRVLVCGGRDYNDRDHIWSTLTELDRTRGPFTTIIHGKQTGADTEAGIWAEANGRRQEPYEAEWTRYGPSAGPRRNITMIAVGKPQLVISFPGGRGTADCVRRARAVGIEVVEVKVRGMA
jgi:hypothetical protein